MIDTDRIQRRTYPTAAFTLTVPQLAWVARRANAMGMSKSAFVRWLIEQDMDDPAPRPVHPEKAEVAA